MGIANEYMIMEQERGWRDVGTFVCLEHCISDSSLRDRLQQFAAIQNCSYCSCYGKAAEFEEVLSIVIPAVEQEFEAITPDTLYDKEQEEYFFSPKIDTCDLFEDLGVSENGEFLAACNWSVDAPWCKKDPVFLSPEDRLLSGWRGFSKELTERGECVQYGLPHVDPYQLHPDEISPEELVFSIIQSVIDNESVTTLKKGTIFYRGRPYKDEEPDHTGRSLGSAPAIFAKSNRMTKTGQPGFYCSEDRETAYQEIRGYTTNENILIGEFKLLTELKLVDLTKQRAIPSIFDEQNSTKRTNLIFIRDFIKTISEPIDPRTEESNYTPTQFVAQLLLDAIDTDSNTPNLGIKWKSSKSPLSSMVLFISNCQCSTIGISDTNCTPIVELDPSTVKNYPPE